jgi:hypothetical protein
MDSQNNQSKIFTPLSDVESSGQQHTNVLYVHLQAKHLMIVQTMAKKNIKMIIQLTHN